MYAAYGDCDIDVRAKVARSVATSLGQSDEVEACVKDALPEDLVQRMFIVGLTKGQAGVDADETLTNDLFSALGKCAPTTTT
jgi:hypothetical protein